MATSVKVNNITAPAATGADATTGVGFQPKALMFLGTDQTATGENNDAQSMVGVSGTGAEDVSYYYNSLHNAASSDIMRSVLTTATLKTTVGGATTARVTATTTSLDADGFTLNYSATTTGILMPYLAIGGADITNTKAGTFALNTSTGNQAVTGVGFQPDVVFFFSNLLTATGTANNNSAHCFGVAKSSSQRWCAALSGQNSQTTMNTRRTFYNTRCLLVLNVTTDTLGAEADFVSMDSDGFTINNQIASASAYLVGYLAIKGGQWKVGSDTQKTSTGTKATTGVGFTPKGLILGSAVDTNTNAVTTTARLALGFSDGTNEQSVWVGDEDNAADAIAKTVYKNDKVLTLYDEASTSTLLAEADLSSFDSDGFTLNWSTADATARDFGYVAFGDNAAGGAVTPKNLALLGVG